MSISCTTFDGVCRNHLLILDGHKAYILGVCTVRLDLVFYQALLTSEDFKYVPTIAPKIGLVKAILLTVFLQNQEKTLVIVA